MSQVIYSEGEGETSILSSKDVTTLVTRPHVTFTSRRLYIRWIGLIPRLCDLGMRLGLELTKD